MRKTLLILGACFILALSLGSCKKCYHCSKGIQSVVNGTDTLITYQTDVCNTGKEGAGTNLNNTIKDYEANDYICNAK